MNFVLRLIISTLAVLITAYILRAGVHVNSFFTGIMVAVILGILNVSIKPLLILVALPAIVFTFGIFLLVINVIVILVADKLIDGFEVDGFWWALLFSLVMWMVQNILTMIKNKDEQAQ